MLNKSDSLTFQQFIRSTPEPKQVQVSSFVNGNNIVNTVSPRRTETLFKKLPTIDSSDDHWKIKKVGSEKLIQTRPLVQPQKLTSPSNFKKMTTMFSEEPQVFDLASSRQFVKKFTIKQKSFANIKSSQEIQLKKSEYKPKQQVGQGHLYEKEKEKTLACPFSTGSQGYLQQFFERSKNKNGHIQRQSEFDQMEELDNQTRDFQMILRSDTLIGPVLGDAHEMKGVVKQIINLAYGNKLQYQYETLRKIHNTLGITDEMFNRFKFLYIKKLISMKSTVEDIFHCAQIIESYRGAITCIDNSVQDIKNHIRVVTKEMYTNIWADYSLSPLFSNAKFDEQVIKFSRIFGFILSTSETTHYVLDSMRDFHREMGITSVQFSIFKFYLSTALHTHVDANAVYYVLEQADCYKAAVINQDSIKNLVYRVHGLDTFINEFNKACIQDPLINKTFVTKMGLEQFQIHTRYFMQYIFNRHNTCFVLQDLQSLHQGVANSKLFQAYKVKFFQLIMKLNPHRIMISDFEEDFDLLEPYITGKPLLCELVGDRLDGFLMQLCMEMKSDYEIVNLYETNDVKMEQNLKRMFNYMLSGRTYFKRSDIQAIHSRLHISEEMFKEFVNKCSRAIEASDPSLSWIVDVVREWKELIISKK